MLNYMQTVYRFFVAVFVEKIILIPPRSEISGEKNGIIVIFKNIPKLITSIIYQVTPFTLFAPAVIQLLFVKVLNQLSPLLMNINSACPPTRGLILI